MKFEKEIVLKVLALAVKDDTPGHHLRYLLQKLYGLDGCSLDSTNQQIYDKMEEIVEGF